MPTGQEEEEKEVDGVVESKQLMMFLDLSRLIHVCKSSSMVGRLFIPPSDLLLLLLMLHLWILVLGGLNVIIFLRITFSLVIRLRIVKVV